MDDEEVVFKSRVKYQTAIFKNQKFRGSKYRGVSRNGKLWQVLIMIKNKKRYVGSYTNELEAAKAYDFTSIQYHGIKALTNFDYKKSQVVQIMESDPLFLLAKE